MRLMNETRKEIKKDGGEEKELLLMMMTQMQEMGFSHSSVDAIKNGPR